MARAVARMAILGGIGLAIWMLLQGIDGSRWTLITGHRS